MARPRLGTHSVPTEERIMTAAEAAFGEFGYEGAKLADIAKVASIRRPSLLYHFNSKEELYTAVIRRVFDGLKLKLLSAMKPGVLDQQIVSLAAAFDEYIRERPAFAPIVLRDFIDGKGPSRDIMANEIGPILHIVEQWVTSQANDLPETLAVRPAILHLCANMLLFAASGPLQQSLWPGENGSMQMAHHIFKVPTSIG